MINIYKIKKMKKVLLIMIGLISGLGFSQFSIEGELKGYNNKPVLIKINENGSERLIKRLETSSVGKFSYDFPFEYVGSLLFELSNARFDMISDNNRISFSTDVNDPKHKVTYDGGANKLVKDYFSIEDKKSLRDYTLVELLKLYKPEDAFYKALSNEVNRIDNLKQINVDNPAIKYYLDTKNKIAKYNDNSVANQFIVNDTKAHILNDNMYLESFGFLPTFLSNYISYSVSGAVNKDEMAVKLEKALDSLLEDVQTDTSRGQAILTIIIPMLEANNFNVLAKKYLDQADSLTCEITPELKDLIKGKSNIQIGEVSPNIEFGRKIKGAKSLYDVKADKKLIVFWASWCPHCMKEFPYLKEFYNSFREKGGEVVAFSLDLEERPFLNATAGTEWINYSDFKKWDSPLVKTFGVTSTPTMILLDKDNKILKIGSKASEFID